MEDHVLYDSIYMKCPKSANLESQKAGLLLLGLGGLEGFR